jgi:hypothetical protein
MGRQMGWISFLRMRLWGGLSCSGGEGIGLVKDLVLVLKSELSYC